MKEKKIIIGNWKMNPASMKEAEVIFRGISKKVEKGASVAICPPSVFLSNLKKLSRRIVLGAQDCHFEERGAYTGEISPFSLYDAGARYVILGHSERRAMGEADEVINKKIKTAMAAGLVSILCVGEKERKTDHAYLSFVKNQLESCLKGIEKKKIGGIVIAYEPVWAIGKSAEREATSEEAREMKIFIKKVISDKFGTETGKKIKVIYGGSVNPKNAGAFLHEGEADGLLVGRDSLDPEKFAKICAQ